MNTMAFNVMQIYQHIIMQISIFIFMNTLYFRRLKKNTLIYGQHRKIFLKNTVNYSSILSHLLNSPKQNQWTKIYEIDCTFYCII